jgi:hypothetical protein
VFFLFPETKGLTLEELAFLFEGESAKKLQSERVQEEIGDKSAAIHIDQRIENKASDEVPLSFGPLLHCFNMVIPMFIWSDGENQPSEHVYLEANPISIGFFTAIMPEQTTICSTIHTFLERTCIFEEERGG